jgi:hypothetical protein
MRLAEAIAGFLDSLTQKSSTLAQTPQAHAYEQATRLLTEYFPPNFQLNEMTEARLRDFLARWYLERVCTSTMKSTESVAPSVSSIREEPCQLPAPQQLLTSMSDFLLWADNHFAHELTARCSQTLTELGETLPRAIEITRLLSKSIRERRGAFGFPEFLTSFEEGGHSQYDIDTPGDVGALEGYFRIIRVAGTLVEAEDLISEERVWPIVFPTEIAALLDRPYVINLEIVRTAQGWEIGDCGFAYPPGMEEV